MQTHGFIDPSKIESAIYDGTRDSMNELKDGGRHQSFTTSGTAPGFIRIAMLLYNKQGIAVFFKGLSLNLVKGPITVGISFTSYDIFFNIIKTYI